METNLDANHMPDCTCSKDLANITLGMCGCGMHDHDTDSNGLLDCNDGCSQVSQRPDLASVVANCQDQWAYVVKKTEPGICRCVATNNMADNATTKGLL